MNKIAVVVDSVHDQQLIARLLATRDYCLFDQCERLCATHDKFSAIIICHRRSQQQPVPRLPASNNFNSRIIVMSEYEDENVIADTLFAGACDYFSLQDTERVLQARIDAALR